MPEQPSKANSTLNNLAGAAKENVGWATGNKSLEAEGKAQRVGADAEHKAAQSQGYAEGAKNSFTGNVKDTVGSALGNERMQAEGKATNMKGEAQKKMNE